MTDILILKKDVFPSCHERGTKKKNSASPWRIEPQTFGFRAPMLYQLTLILININFTHLSWKAWSSVPFNILFTQSSLTNLEGENSWSFWLLVYIILNDTLRYFTLLLCAGCQVAQITVIKWVIPLMGKPIIPTLLPVLPVLQTVVNGSTFEFKSIWIETSPYTTRALLWSHIQPISVQKSVAEFWLQMVSEISSSSAISASASNRMYITQFIAIRL